MPFTLSKPDATFEAIRQHHGNWCVPIGVTLLGRKWRELIKKVWEADPLRCLKCSGEMRIVSLIDEEDVIERILRHLGLW